MKLGLPKTRAMVLDLIEKGKDFEVQTMEIGWLIKLPIVKEDIEPHVCDFLKAGIDKDIIAYYFAVLIATPGYTVKIKDTFKELETNEIKTMADDFRIGKIEKEIMPKVYQCQKERLDEEEMNK